MLCKYIVFYYHKSLYSTVNATTLLAGQERATAGEDYLLSSGMIFMAENVTTASVHISILPVSY